MRFITVLAAVALTWQAQASSNTQGDYLVKSSPETVRSFTQNMKSRLPAGAIVEDLGLGGWVRVKLPENMAMTFSTRLAFSQPGVVNVQPNIKLGLLNNYMIKDPAKREALLQRIQQGGFPGGTVPPDNPAIPASGSGGSGSDPLFSSQWGMNQIGVTTAWNQTKGNPDIVVAVIDTGVDYTHEDLVDNMWRNPGEIAGNGIDDDGNGYVDDIVGWDFVSNDNKPYDFTTSILDMLTGGGNPGHGTHCAGNVAARGDNGKGVAGVAPNVKIMALRFLSEKGQGTTADAVKAIKYAVDNGAHITSNSWGSVGEDTNDPDNQALRDAIRYSQEKNVLFVAAAGNGDQQGRGYDNDTSRTPAFPASYPDDVIVSVAAVDVSGNLGSFSNWGARSVDLGAPGVKVFSTTVDNNYSDTVIDFAGITAHWDGTSMATPHVAGAAALYLSKHPTATAAQIKAALINSVRRTSQMSSKSTSGGQLDMTNLLNMQFLRLNKIFKKPVLETGFFLSLKLISPNAQISIFKEQPLLGVWRAVPSPGSAWADLFIIHQLLRSVCSPIDWESFR